MYNKAGVNPMAGCIPALFSFLFMYASFQFFPAAFELRQKGFPFWGQTIYHLLTQLQNCLSAFRCTEITFLCSQFWQQLQFSST
ncbi:hypothetical protein ACFFWB_26955 [Flavobacterium procerum]|uniref:hypothetical protein n=1 Tax=Flavobacterium procerum TaxID=1455569 RepID=UPI0035E93DE1